VPIVAHLQPVVGRGLVVSSRFVAMALGGVLVRVAVFCPQGGLFVRGRRS
jgi:hypothetical protein